VALALQKLEVPEAPQALRQALAHRALRVKAARALRRYGRVSDLRPLTRDIASRAAESRLTAAAAIVILASQARAEVD